MDRQDRKRIQFYYTELVDNVRARDVCDFLFQHEIITDEQLEEITKFQMTTKERVRTLLRILMNNGKRKDVFSIFCQSLRFCDDDVSRHLADQLESGDISVLSSTEEKLRYDIPPDVVLTEAKKMRIFEPIGDGAFGLVYRADHEVFGLVAYKKLQTISMYRGYNKVKKELLHEANMQRLNHPNIVRLVAVTCEPEHYGLLLEYMMHGDLDRFLSEFQVKIALKIHIIYDVALGMNYLHNLMPPIIHGDLKVQNVLIGDGFRAKITDFGLARWKMYSTIKTSASSFKGTITHIPPEQFRNVNLSRTLKTDVYSFGILFWETLSQKKPFDQVPNPSLIIHAVIDRQRPNMADVDNMESTPESIKDMIAACWDDNPDYRPLFGQVKLTLEMILKDMQESVLSARDDLFNEELHKFRQKEIEEIYGVGSPNVKKMMKQISETTNVTSEYLSRPTRVHTMSRGLAVCGVTVLFNEVFIVCNQDKPQVEVYDSMTLTLQRHLKVKELVEPYDMTSSVKFKCLYISDEGCHDNMWRIHRMELSGETTSWKLYDVPAGLSVMRDGCNIIVSCIKAGKLKEFTTHGDLVREICLQDDVINPYHAVQLSHDQLVVCHGKLADSLHRVCIVDARGHVILCYGGPPGSEAGQMEFPSHLAVDEDGNILVADRNNRRILLLSGSLNRIRELISSGDLGTVGYPHRLFLHETRLYVAGIVNFQVFVVK